MLSGASTTTSSAGTACGHFGGAHDVPTSICSHVSSSQISEPLACTLHGSVVVVSTSPQPSEAPSGTTHGSVVATTVVVTASSPPVVLEIASRSPNAGSMPLPDCALARSITARVSSNGYSPRASG